MLFLPAVAFLSGVALTLLTLPHFIQSALRKNVVGFDVNKQNRPAVANLGGVILFFAFAGAILASILLATFIQKNFMIFTELLAALSAVSILAVVGLYDDVFRISARMKVLLPVLGALPLIAITAGDTTLTLPYFGLVDLGPLYTFLLIPLGVTGAANAVNMTAGYNGLEAGIGAIASFFLLLIALAAGATSATVILAALFGTCLAFLAFNWHPAKVFPADIGTLAIGGAIACAVILGNMEKYGVLVLLPAFYELAATIYYSLKKTPRRDACHHPQIRQDGALLPPPGAEYFSLAYCLLSKKPMREPILVTAMLSLFALSGLLALAVYWLKI